MTYRNKKYVKIIPLSYNSYNYGGTLQYFALQNALNSLGENALVLDIDNFGEKVFSNLNREKRNKKNIEKVINKLFWEYSKYKTKKMSSYFNRRKQRFDLFRENYIVSEKGENLEDIQNNTKAFICGSDQIWNPYWAKTTYFMNFIKDKTIIRIIYAASSGRSELTENQCLMYLSLLQGINAISVREENLYNQLKYYLGTNVRLTIDPVFLVNKDVWNRLLCDKTSHNGADFVFCYILGESLEIRHQIKNEKRSLGAKIISIPYVTEKYIYGEDYADDKVDYADPIDFLGLISSAKFVITDSFHAVAFSIIFHRDFVVLDREPGHSQMISRIHTLLRYFGLEDHLVPELSLYKSLRIDWETVDQKMDLIKKESLNFLKEALNLSDR